MKKHRRVYIILLLIVVILSAIPTGCKTKSGTDNRQYSAKELNTTAEGIIRWAKAQVGVSSIGNLMNGSFSEQAGSSDADWYAIAIGRLGYKDDYSAYLTALKSYVENKYLEEGKLSSNKATEWHRIALAVLSLGGDPTSFGVDCKGRDINLIQDGTYNRGYTTELGAQGINGWIWGLLTLDALAYKIPDKACSTRNEIITEIIRKQHSDGGFSLNGGYGDPDITAMAVQALAPYYNSEEIYVYNLDDTGQKASYTIREVVDRAIVCLSNLQGKDGDFDSYGDYNAEGTAQVIIALCSVGINPLKDDRFIKNGNSLVDGLMKYKNDDGGFIHSYSSDENNTSAIGGKSDPIAAEQALCALCAIIRHDEGLRRLYDFRNEMSDKLKEQIADIEDAIENLGTSREDTSTQLYREKVQELYDSYINVPVEERSYVKNYFKLSDIMKDLGMENTSEYLSEGQGQNSGGDGSVTDVLAIP